jgi:hypothetical protein
MLSNDAFDVIWAVFAKGDLQALCAFFALGRQAVLVFAIDLWGLLTVADEVNDWVSLGMLVLCSKKESRSGRWDTIFMVECHE